MTTTKAHKSAETQLEKSLAKANLAYAQGDFSLSEKTLTDATRICGLMPVELEHLFNLLAGLACKQGMFATAAYWYLQVLQSRISRKNCSKKELSRTKQCYCSLLELSQRQNLRQDLIWYRAS